MIKTATWSNWSQYFQGMSTTCAISPCPRFHGNNSYEESLVQWYPSLFIARIEGIQCCPSVISRFQAAPCVRDPITLAIMRTRCMCDGHTCWLRSHENEIGVLCTQSPLVKGERRGKTGNQLSKIPIEVRILFDLSAVSCPNVEMGFILLITVEILLRKSGWGDVTSTQQEWERLETSKFNIFSSKNDFPSVTN